MAGKTRKIKKKIQPVEGNKRGRTIKVKKDVFKTPVTESGQEFKEQKQLTDEAKRISSRKFKVPKPASLTQKDDPNTIAEGDGETPLAPIPNPDISRKRKVKRKKK